MLQFPLPATVERVAALDPAVRRMLREDLPSQLRDIRTACSRNDWQTVIQLVHAVRGAAAFCQLQSLSTSAARLESRLKLESNTKKENEDDDAVRVFEHDVQDVLHALELTDN